MEVTAIYIKRKGIDGAVTGGWIESIPGLPIEVRASVKEFKKAIESANAQKLNLHKEALLNFRRNKSHTKYKEALDNLMKEKKLDNKRQDLIYVIDRYGENEFRLYGENWTSEYEYRLELALSKKHRKEGTLADWGEPDLNDLADYLLLGF